MKARRKAKLLTRAQAERRKRKLLPAPPPTPKGKVLASMVSPWGQKTLRFMLATELALACRNNMGDFDRLPPDERERYRNARDNDFVPWIAPPSKAMARVGIMRFKS